MTRYRLGRIVSEWDGEDLWVGALPDGPIGRVEGVGALVLEALEGGVVLDVDDVMDALHADVVGIPVDARPVVGDFLRDLAEKGVIVTVGRGKQ